MFSTERQQGDSPNDSAGEHVDQGGPCQEGQLQGQDGEAQQEEQEEGWTGQVGDSTSGSLRNDDLIPLTSFLSPQYQASHL